MRGTLSLAFCYLGAFLFYGCGSETPAQVERVKPAPSPMRSPIGELKETVDAGDSSTAVQIAPPATAPEPELPDAPEPPTRSAHLAVEGFARASHVGPSGEESWPRPVVVVLHGNYDRPEWECDTWADVASFYGWVVCPRGVRTPWASRAEDRWTYNGKGQVSREMAAVLVALEEKYPGRVSRDGMVLAGFSLGGILAPGLVKDNPGMFQYLFLAEGGVKNFSQKTARTLAAARVKGVGLAMSAPGRRTMARKAVGYLEKAGVKAVFVDMKGAGHNYRGDFGETGRVALEILIEGVPATDGGVPGGE